MTLFLLISLVAADYLPQFDLNQPLSCKKYSCAPSTVTKEFSKSCVYSPTGSSNVYLWTCPAQSTTNYCNTTSGSCQVPPVASDPSYVGEPCKLTSDCYLSSCLQGVCRGLATGQRCTAHEQCDLGLRCSVQTLTCQPQIYANQTGCSSYLDCVNWATCNQTFSSENGVCLAYNSVPLGKVVTDCVNGFSYLCQTAYCVSRFSMSMTGVCALAPVSYGLMPKACNSDLDCIGYVNGKNVTSNCVCGYNPLGTSYCSPFIGDLPGINMLSAWKTALQHAGNCNTAQRSSMACMKMIEMAKNTTQATLGYYFYANYIGNDACVMEIYNYDYYYSQSVILVTFLSFIHLIF